MGLATEFWAAMAVVPLSLWLLLILTLPTSVAFYRLYFSPLSHIPGPPFACVSSLFLYFICYRGIEGRALLYYHQKYNTPVLRVAPNSVSLSGGDALHPVYIARGGLPKDARYENFRVEGHDTIFSTRDIAYRDARAKAVLPLFAPSRIRASCETGICRELIEKFVYALRCQREEAFSARSATRREIDILDLSSRLSIDVLTGYLFGKTYGGLEEKREEGNTSAVANNGDHQGHGNRWRDKLSATPFVLAIVAFSRFSLLPNWLFTLVFSLLMGPTLSKPDVAASLATVSRFVDSIAGAHNERKTASDSDTYQSRLSRAGVSHQETLIQCKAAMFAGADSTAVLLSTILFHLVRRPAVRKRLKEELRERQAGVDYQSLPYLQAVIREGLRLGMANPARLTRIVPSQSTGCTISGVFLPPGTIVGAAAYVFHHNPKVFPQPFEFLPERWLASDEETGARRLKESDIFPYGLGSRACLGRNLANQQLFTTVASVVESDALDGAVTRTDRIDLIEWFNAEIKGHVLEIQWQQ
ncbi:cytochrome P450 [Aspergillus ustus]|uniref:Cytochrome P450 n=1 Tax=Aspergillus ustus TaxID=40382 RepID=A0A0C1E677_ASPUT|nr:cytochrome P450 [Aspergillus ustus]